jgi:hypothetical protein
VDLPLGDWRQPVVMGVPTFQVAALTITRRDTADGPERTDKSRARQGKPHPAGGKTQVIRAARGPSGRWRLTAPVMAPANDAKIESLLSALASLRVVDGPKGFVADNVQDLARFGLAAPEITVELKTIASAGDETMVLDVGKPVPDQPERVYVRQGDQDDVVMVDAKALGEIPPTATALRSQQVADIDPAQATAFQIQTQRELFSLKRESTGWELESPRKERADRALVQSFLQHISDLQSSQFLDPDQIPNLQLDPPVMTITIWQTERTSGRRPSEAGSSPGTPPVAPALKLRLGRYDITKKTIFAQLENDQVVLALPDTLHEVLPKNPLAFRDLTILTENPVAIRKLTIQRGERTDVLEPDKTGSPNQWRMRAPVEGPADAPSVTQALAALANLRAEGLVTDSVGDGKAFGLDRPGIEVAWESDRLHRLKIGGQIPRKPEYFATLVDQPLVFTLSASTVGLFEAEFRNHRVLSFPADRAERVILRWPHHSVALHRRPVPAKGQVEWVPDPGTELQGLDLSRISGLIATLAQLQTTRFFQYEGTYPALSGVRWPRLTVEIQLSPNGPNPILRIGNRAGAAQVCAALGTADEGPGFFLPAPPWDDLIASGEHFPPIPDNPFAPAP